MSTGPGWLLSLVLVLSGCGAAYQLSLERPGEDAFVVTERAKTHVLRRGSGSPVVFIHGNLGSTQDLTLAPVYQDLLKEHSVFAYDRPGFGHSLCREGVWNWTPKDFADHLAELLQREGIETPVLLAHSWGGAIALAYAVHYPERLSGMVLLAPAAYPWPGYFATSPDQWFVAAPVLGDLFLQTLFVPLAMSFGEEALRGVFDPGPVPEQYLEKALPLAIQPTVYQNAARDTIELRRALRGQSERYGEIQVPTIVITDPNDTTVPPKIHARPLVQALDDAHLVEAPGVGHQVLFGGGDEIFDAIRTLKADSESRGG